MGFILNLLLALILFIGIILFIIFIFFLLIVEVLWSFMLLKDVWEEFKDKYDVDIIDIFKSFESKDRNRK